MPKKIWSTPYEAVRAAKIKSKKNRSNIKTEWIKKDKQRPNELYSSYIKRRNKAMFETNILGRRAHTYGSSLK